MHHTFGNHESLQGLQVDRSVLEVDDEMSLEDEKELVVIVVLVPVIFALHHPDADHRVVHFAQRLVVPLVAALRDEGGNIHHGQRCELDVQVRGIRKIFGSGHGCLLTPRRAPAYYAHLV